MSYLDKCVVKTDIMLRKLRPSRNLIIFVYNQNTYIPVSREDMNTIMKSPFIRSNETTNKNENFYKIPNEIHVDSSLEECYQDRNNTMKLELKGKFKYDGNSFTFFGVTPMKRKEINELKEKDFFINHLADEVENEESDDDEKQWNKISKKTRKTGAFVDYFNFNVKRIQVYDNHVLKEEKWFENDVLHRNDDEDDLPAYIEYYDNGKISVEKWYKKGKLHRMNKPAWLEWYESGEKKAEGWYQEGVHHTLGDNCDDLPCATYYYKNGNKQKDFWFQNGKLNRENDLPSCIIYFENGKKKQETWYQNDKLHRDHALPAVITCHENGNKKEEKWFNNGRLHNDKKPAWITYFENGNKEAEEWCQNDKIHNHENPAIIIYFANGNKKEEAWYQNGILESPTHVTENKLVFEPAYFLYFENGKIHLEKYFENNCEVKTIHYNKPNCGCSIQYIK